MALGRRRLDRISGSPRSSRTESRPSRDPGSAGRSRRDRRILGDAGSGGRLADAARVRIEEEFDIRRVAADLHALLAGGGGGGSDGAASSSLRGPDPLFLSDVPILRWGLALLFGRRSRPTRGTRRGPILIPPTTRRPSSTQDRNTLSLDYRARDGDSSSPRGPTTARTRSSGGTSPGRESAAERRPARQGGQPEPRRPADARGDPPSPRPPMLRPEALRKSSPLADERIASVSGRLTYANPAAGAAGESEGSTGDGAESSSGQQPALLAPERTVRSSAVRRRCYRPSGEIGRRFRDPDPVHRGRPRLDPGAEAVSVEERRVGSAGVPPARSESSTGCSPAR